MVPINFPERQLSWTRLYKFSFIFIYENSSTQRYANETFPTPLHTHTDRNRKMEYFRSFRTIHISMKITTVFVVRSHATIEEEKFIFHLHHTSPSLSFPLYSSSICWGFFCFDSTFPQKQFTVTHKISFVGLARRRLGYGKHIKTKQFFSFFSSTILAEGKSHSISFLHYPTIEPKKKMKYSVIELNGKQYEPCLMQNWKNF